MVSEARAEVVSPPELREAEKANADGLTAFVLAGLAFFLPFEPRRAVLSLAGFQFTFLEVAAALTILLLAGSCRGRLMSLARRPPAVLLLTAAFAATHLLSAALAPEHKTLAAKFALRMLAMAAFAWAVAAAPRRAHRAALAALTVGSSAVAVLSILEVTGVSALDPFLARFREMPFNVAGFRRASGGSEYPNLAAGFLIYGLQAACGLAMRARRPLRAALPLALLLSVGLLETYSRGALMAAAASLAVLSFFSLWSDRGLARVGLVALAVLGTVALVFALDGEVFRLRLEYASTTSWYGAQYAPAEAALQLRPGEVRTTDVRVTNAGRKAWTVGEEFHLSYHWFDPERKMVTEGARTNLPRDLPAGDSVMLRAEVRAPDQPGRYLLVWDMVHENTTWFSGQGVPPAQVPVTVEGRPVPPRDRAAGGVRPRPLVAPAAAPPAPDVSWRPARWELWRIALALWKQRPLTGVGSDNFRWLYGVRSGHPIWDSRIFANNLFLETAADTGVLGLLALCAMLGAAALGAGRAARDAAAPPMERVTAAVLFSLVVTVAVHGMADYLLAFTGHYLVLGLVLGAAAVAGGAPSPARG